MDSRNEQVARILGWEIEAPATTATPEREALIELWQRVEPNSHPLSLKHVEKHVGCPQYDSDPALLGEMLEYLTVQEWDLQIRLWRDGTARIYCDRDDETESIDSRGETLSEALCDALIQEADDGNK